MAIPRFKCRNQNCRAHTIEYSIAIVHKDNDSLYFADGDKTPSYCPWCSKNVLITDDQSSEVSSVPC